jgi:hypothetical protein
VEHLHILSTALAADLMMIADAAAETPAAWPVAATYNCSMRQIAMALMQPFADLGDTDMTFALGAMLAGSDPDEATV